VYSWGVKPDIIIRIFCKCSNSAFSYVVLRVWLQFPARFRTAPSAEITMRSCNVLIGKLSELCELRLPRRVPHKANIIKDMKLQEKHGSYKDTEFTKEKRTNYFLHCACRAIIVCNYLARVSVLLAIIRCLLTSTV